MFILINIMPFTQMLLWGVYAFILPVAGAYLVCSAGDIIDHYTLKVNVYGSAIIAVGVFLLYLFLIAADRLQYHYLQWFTSLVGQRVEPAIELSFWCYVVGLSMLLVGQGVTLHQYMKIRK